MQRSQQVQYADGVITTDFTSALRLHNNGEYMVHRLSWRVHFRQVPWRDYCRGAYSPVKYHSAYNYESSIMVRL